MSSFDEEALRKGTVPWSAEECAEVMEWYHGVVNTPKDDWDLKERGSVLQDDEGNVSKFRFNMFQPMNQLGFYMARRYKPDVMPYHLHRFMLIMDFLSGHQQDLLNDGLAKPGGEDFNEIRSEVLQALCVLRFAESVESDGGGEWYGFDYDQVVCKARELIRGASGLESD